MCLELGNEESQDVWVWFGYTSRVCVFAEAAHPAPRACWEVSSPARPTHYQGPKVPEQSGCWNRNQAEAFGNKWLLERVQLSTVLVSREQLDSNSAAMQETVWGHCPPLPCPPEATVPLCHIFLSCCSCGSPVPWGSCGSTEISVLE